VPANLDRVPAVLEDIVRRGVDVGFPQDRLRLNLRVGVCEALSNAIRHGEREGRGSVRVEVAFSAETIEVRITDSGGGFDPEDVPDPTLPENISRPGGRGVFLIQQLMDHVEYNDVGNALRMVLHARARDAGGDG
jgi:serine/threonine-protein kinase RsbW